MSAGTLERLSVLVERQIRRIVEHELQRPPEACDVKQLRELTGLYNAVRELVREETPTELTVRFIGHSQEAAE